MKNQAPGLPSARQWGEFRFSVIGALLASPPGQGELKPSLEELAGKTWRHPLSGEPYAIRYGTIEDWYYRARANADDPVSALSNGPRSDRGFGQELSERFKAELLSQYRRFPDWSVQLHADNLSALVGTKPELGEAPSYATIRRYMKQEGLIKKKKIHRKKLPGLALAEARLEKKEVRSFEMDHIGALWHLDFHHGSRKLQNERGEWQTLYCLAVHDDHSRLACHVQWYTEETAKTLIHGVSQAIMKRGRPWAIMTDNGSAMKAQELTEGLSRLGIMHNNTLPYSAYQNGKTERFWGVLEGRFLAMLKDTEITLKLLNDATIAWIEGDYHRATNKEMNESPYDRLRKSNDISRPSPSAEDLRLAFRMEISRNQRRSDGTVSIDGIRFEIPHHYRRVDVIRLRYARWDMSLVHQVDTDGKVLSRLYRLDKSANSQSIRRPIEVDPEITLEPPKSEGLPPLLEKLMADFSETGIPASYIPEENNSEQ